MNVEERLRKAKISFVTTNYDVANAHPSPSHASLSEALVDTLHEDTGLLRQRHELATMEIQGADESILIRPGSGTAQGSEGAADAYHMTTSVLTNGPITCELNCCKRRSFFKAPPATPDLFNSPFFMGLTTYADDVPVTSITTEPVHTWSRVMSNNAALDTALDEMAQNTAKQEHSVFFTGQRARQYMAFLNGKGRLPGSQDRWLGTLVLTSTLWAAFDLNSKEGARRPSEPGPDFAQCGFVQASHCVFGAFFPGAGGFNSVYGSGIPSLAIPGLRIFGPFYLGSWAKDDERKNDN